MKASFFIYYFLFVAAMAFTGSPQAASAAGFGVSPSDINFVVENGLSASRQLIIYNTGPASVFTVVSEDSAIAVEPSSGTLEKGNTAAIIVTASGKKPGKSASEILVSLAHGSGNPDGEVRLSLGTRVRVSLSVVESALQSANPFVGALISAAMVVAGLLVYLPTRNRIRRPAYLGWRWE